MSGLIFPDVMSSLSGVLVAVVGGWFAKEAGRRKKYNGLREEESRLSMRMMSASVSLGVATAIAVRDNKLNGEMTAAMEKAKKVQEEYGAFLAKIASHEVAK